MRCAAQTMSHHYRVKNFGSNPKIKLFHCSYLSKGTGKGEHLNIVRMASSAATRNVRSVASRILLSTSAVKTFPSLSNVTIMSTISVFAPAVPIGGDQHDDTCWRIRSMSERPSGPTTGFSGARVALPAAVVNYWSKFQPLLCVLFRAVSFRHLRIPPWPWQDFASPRSTPHCAVFAMLFGEPAY